MHDRSDYKSGWQLDLEWEEQQKQKALNPDRFIINSDDDDESSSDEELPFACFICREDFKNPVVTK
jgi:RING finger protein 113A